MANERDELIVAAQPDNESETYVEFDEFTDVVCSLGLLATAARQARED